MTTEIVRFPVSGMTCGSCVNRIMRSVGRVDGVTKVSVNLRAETATVRREPERVTDHMLATAVAAAGYQADLGRRELLPPGSDRSLLDRLLGRS
ncbi:MAG: cation transporter [Candidatus Limnocylindrales bacterium]